MLSLLILDAFMVKSTPHIRKGFFLSVLMAVVVHIVLLLAARVFGRIFGLDPVERCSLIYTNVGNFAVVIVSSIFGSEWVIYVTGYLAVQMFLFWTHGASLLRDPVDAADGLAVSASVSCFIR